MCGNFGLLWIGQHEGASGAQRYLDSSLRSLSNVELNEEKDALGESLSPKVIYKRLGDLNSGLTSLAALQSTSDAKSQDESLMPILTILQAQASATEIRGGQAGGISSLEFDTLRPRSEFAQESSTHRPPNRVPSRPHVIRVRCVARKRYPLATDLINLYHSNIGSFHSFDVTTTKSFICHTRFATSSVNVVSELHPHEWTPFQDEYVWDLNQATGRFERHLASVGCHITHNGDFDALNIYDSHTENGDVGFWLERVLHIPNDTKGDSPKIAGCMDLMRVKGRWAAAARLAYVRCMCQTPSDVSGGKLLDKQAPNSFPPGPYFLAWEALIEGVWRQHMNNIITNIAMDKWPSTQYSYSIDQAAVAQFEDALLAPALEKYPTRYDSARKWSQAEMASFLFFTVKGFLLADLYATMAEFQSRAEGSFGLQVHCTLEPGIVVLASKGQPMSVAFDKDVPIVLFGSEAEAISVPVKAGGAWLSNRLDLNSKGEVVRVGLKRACTVSLLGGSRKTDAGSTSSFRIELQGGAEIRSYLLDAGTEVPEHVLRARVVEITKAAPLYNPCIDLVGSDIKAVPRVLAKINSAWGDESSPEYTSGKQLFESVVASSKLHSRGAHIDLLLLGIETSLWILEQWAVDMRRLFPALVIVTESSNKVLNYGGQEANGIINAGLPLNIASCTCVLLVSQSGQTFGTLHATRRLAGLNHKNVWILTGCLNSKMQTALEEAYVAKKDRYGCDRVIFNYSGTRPAEPTSVAIVASMHTLTKITLQWLDIIAAAFDAGAERRRSGAAGDESNTLDESVSVVNAESDPIKDSKRELQVFHGESALAIAITRHCIDDIHFLCESSVNSMEMIVGRDRQGREVVSETNKRLLSEGRRLAAHVGEYWNILVFAGIYIILSVGLGLPLWGLLSDAVVAALRAAYGEGFMEGQSLSFSPRDLKTLYSQPWQFTVIGVAIQLIDALWFVFIGKIATWFFRWLHGRPLWARHGKRTIVIVDSSCIHQLTEMFVSKLFSQAYSFVSVDVHGANGFDHFVHRFTHRVVRGLLLVVGRPDGRLCCLSKSELTLLLSVKQAAFIQNPAYHPYGNTGFGPDVITVGHNPFESSLGLSSNVVLGSDSRGRFVDEILYTTLFESSAPFTGSILMKLSQAFRRYKRSSRTAVHPSPCPEESTAAHVHGSQFIDLFTTDADESLLFEHALKHLRSTLTELKDKTREGGGGDAEKTDARHRPLEPSNNPAARAAFCSKLDSMAQKIQDAQCLVQYFYESRCASVERYVAFCVMFHAMAIRCSSPLLMRPWDISRSQSNLRVATTASPVSAVASDSHVETGRGAGKIKKELLRHATRVVVSHF